MQDKNKAKKRQLRLIKRRPAENGDNVFSEAVVLVSELMPISGRTAKFLSSLKKEYLTTNKSSTTTKSIKRIRKRKRAKSSGDKNGYTSSF